MKRPPVPRPRIYDLYWYFAAERQRVFERRTTGQPPPWTDDPILREFKFCNVYRAADRVSQYMIRDVCYHDEPCSPEDRLFQIVAFRTFSKIETWRAVRDFLGRYPPWTTWQAAPSPKRLITRAATTAACTPGHSSCAQPTPTASRPSTATTSSCSGTCSPATAWAGSCWRPGRCAR